MTERVRRMSEESAADARNAFQEERIREARRTEAFIAARNDSCRSDAELLARVFPPQR